MAAPAPFLSIVADENIPLVVEAFSPFGPVRTLPGRTMTAADLEGTDVLLVRSVTRVDQALLAGTALRFVGTATIGTDHIDLDGLAERGVAFASAPGSNADSVADYLMCALHVLAARTGKTLAGMTLGIVGVGNIGSRVARRAEALGLRVLRNDPPRARAEGAEGFVSLEALIDAADIVTFHTPLHKQGPDRTLHLADAATLAGLRDGAWVINTSRGSVVDNPALRAELERGRLHAWLDVWEGEPGIDPALLERVAIATPHVGGYALDGKVRGTVMLRDALCKALSIAPEAVGAWDPDVHLPAVEPATIEVDGALSAQDAVAAVCHRAWDIMADDQRLRATAALEEAPRLAAFDRLRKTYPIRREFSKIRVTGATGPLAQTLAGIGFTIDTDPGADR